MDRSEGVEWSVMDGNRGSKAELEGDCDVAVVVGAGAGGSVRRERRTFAALLALVLVLLPSLAAVRVGGRGLLLGVLRLAAWPLASWAAPLGWRLVGGKSWGLLSSCGWCFWW